MGHPTHSATAPTYLDDSTYQQLVDALLAAPGAMCPSSEVKLALGEALNVWPAAIREDAQAASLDAARADLPAGFSLGVSGDLLRVRGLGRAKTAHIMNSPADEVSEMLVRKIEAEASRAA